MFCKITLFRCYHHFFHIHYTRKNRFLASAKHRFLCLIYLIHDIVFHSALRNSKCYGKLRIQVAFCHPQITLVSRCDLLSLLQAGHLPLIKGLDDPHQLFIHIPCFRLRFFRFCAGNHRIPGVLYKFCCKRADRISFSISSGVLVGWISLVALPRNLPSSLST